MLFSFLHTFIVKFSLLLYSSYSAVGSVTRRTRRVQLSGLTFWLLYNAFLSPSLAHTLSFQGFSFPNGNRGASLSLSLFYFLSLSLSLLGTQRNDSKVVVVVAGLVTSLSSLFSLRYASRLSTPHLTSPHFTSLYLTSPHAYLSVNSNAHTRARVSRRARASKQAQVVHIY